MVARRVIYQVLFAGVAVGGLWLFWSSFEAGPAWQGATRPRATPAAGETTEARRTQADETTSRAQPPHAAAAPLDGPAMEDEIRYFLKRDPKRAEELAREYQRRFPDGPDLDENDANLVYAVWNQRHVDRAMVETVHYFRRHPGGRYTDDLSRLTGLRPPRNRWRKGGMNREFRREPGQVERWASACGTCNRSREIWPERIASALLEPASVQPPPRLLIGLARTRMGHGERTRSLAAPSRAVRPSPRKPKRELPRRSAGPMRGRRGRRFAREESVLAKQALHDLGAGARLEPAHGSAAAWASIEVRLRLADRARVLDDDGVAAGRVVSLAAGALELGVQARVGDVLSKGNVRLADRAELLGSVKTSGMIVQGQNNTILGPVATGATVVAPDLSGFVSDFPGVGGEYVHIERDQVRYLAPGSYGTLEVKGGGLVQLSSGVYSFSSVITHHQSMIEVDTTFGAAVLHSLGTVSWAAQPVAPDFSDAKFALVHHGSTDIVVEAPFAGTLISPAGGVSLGTPGTPYYGAFFAKRIELQPDVIVTHRSPVAPGIAGEPPGAACGNGVLEAGEACDDGNRVAGDGCDAACQIESGGQLTAVLPLSSDWGSGYCAVVEVTNHAALPTSDWSVVLNTNGATIYTSWNGTFSPATGSVTVEPASWNQVIPAGGAINSVGFCANRDGSSSLPSVTSVSGSF